MSGEFTHADPGNDLTHAEFIATGAHVASGQTAGDVLYFDGTNWIRKPANTITTSSLFSTQTDVTASRALDAVYVNLNAFPIMIMASVQGEVQNNTTPDQLNGTGGVVVNCSSSNPPATTISQSSVNIALSGLTAAIHLLSIAVLSPVIFIVPSGYYYQISDCSIDDGVGLTQIEIWIEYGGIGTVV